MWPYASSEAAIEMVVGYERGCKVLSRFISLFLVYNVVLFFFFLCETKVSTALILLCTSSFLINLTSLSLLITKKTLLFSFYLFIFGLDMGIFFSCLVEGTGMKAESFLFFFLIPGKQAQAFVPSLSLSFFLQSTMELVIGNPLP